MTSRRPPETLHLVFAALGGILLLFVVAPLAGVLLGSPPARLAEAAADPEVGRSIWFSLWTSMAATAVFGLAAVPFAYLLARREFPLKRLVTAIVDLPVIVPHSAAGIAVLGIIARTGPAGALADRLGWTIVGTPVATMLAMAFVSLPFLVNAARDGFMAVPERLERAALNLGASPGRVFLTISLPLAWRAVLSGFILMWARGMSEFGAVVIVAYRPMVAPVLIWERFGAFGLAYARPVAALFLAVCLVVFVILRLLSREVPRARG